MDQIFQGNDLLSDDIKVDEPAEDIGELAIDVYQTDGEVVVKAPMAGVKPEDLELSIGDDTITIKGRRQTEHELKEGDYFVRECYWGSFERTVALPVPVEGDKARAHFKHGLLTITMPKSEQSRTRKIEIVTD